MKCLKCKGWLCTEFLSDFNVLFDIWRCVNCGARFDKTILENQKVFAHAHAEGDDYEEEDASW